MIKALKPLCFGGRKFTVGEIIPEEIIAPDRIEPLTEMKQIVEVYDVPVRKQGGAVRTVTETREVFDRRKLQKANRAELEELAAARGISTSGLNKAGIISRLCSE